jgi:DNA repair exonuclease SbcCD ATPase subunit
MIYLIIITLAIILADITYFIVLNSKTKEQIVSTNTKLDQMFDFLRDDVVKINLQVKDLKQEIEVVKQIQLVNSKKIEALENQVNQLRSGTNSRFY